MVAGVLMILAYTPVLAPFDTGAIAHVSSTVPCDRLKSDRDSDIVEDVVLSLPFGLALTAYLTRQSATRLPCLTCQYRNRRYRNHRKLPAVLATTTGSDECRQKRSGARQRSR